VQVGLSNSAWLGTLCDGCEGFSQGIAQHHSFLRLQPEIDQAADQPLDQLRAEASVLDFGY
jgi:hypothetical protein